MNGFELVSKGGHLLMAPILLTSWVVLGIAFERAVFWYRVRRAGEGARSLLLEYGADGHEIIPQFCSLALTMGLLGSVVGLIQAFSFEGGMDPARAVKGIGTAYVTTAAGIVASLQGALVCIVCGCFERFYRRQQGAHQNGLSERKVHS